MTDFLKKPWLVYVVAIPYFFCVNWYLGIQIDGVLYTQQVIHRWFPERFVGDPQFMFGNQDSFTVFSHVYGFLMCHLPIDVAAMTITFGSQLLFAIALILFIRSITKKYRLEYLVLPFSLLFFTLYAFGSARTTIFFSRLVEPYPVPRTLAVSFAILGLAMLFYKKKWITVLLTLIGMAFHPLMAGWVLPIWLFYHFPKARLPVIGVSAFVPLLGYIGETPFASYPDGWYYRPLTYGPKVLYAMRFVAYIAFFVVFIKKINKNEAINKFCCATVIVVSIAFYWYLWTGINNFILLYQFQVWRMEWLCIVVVFPLCVSTVWNVWLRYRKERYLNTHDVAPFFCMLSMLSSVLSIDGLIAAVIILILPAKKIDSKKIDALALYYPALNLIMSGYLYLFFLGVPLYGFSDYSTADACHYRFLQITLVISIVYGAYLIKKHDWLRAVLFLLYPVLPQFMILPIIAIAWPYLKKKQSVFLLFFAIADGMFNFTTRYVTGLLSSFEKQQLLSVVLFGVFFLGGYRLFMLKKMGGVAKICILLPILFTVPYAALHWDHRKEDLKLEESNLDQFKWNASFPQISERDRIFYYVRGRLSGDSRLQFLTGNYVDTKTTVGEIFKESHHKEAVGRLNALIYKNRKDSTFTSVYKRGRIMGDFFEESLAKPGILVDRVNYLCETDEISYLVSDFDNLPYAKQDSLRMNVLNKEIYLYACP